MQERVASIRPLEVTSALSIAPLTIAQASELSRKLVQSIGQVVEGKQAVIEMVITALLARGHVLIEDVPGVGKTTLARALAASVGADARRIQFTSDLLPADVLGGSIYDPKSGALDFRPGPIFAPIVLADEINRTTPRTQSALLEAMEERRVSIEGVTRALPEPFFVMATQNPDEFAGTYPLPESQLDRFIVRTDIGHPSPEIERKILQNRQGRDPVADLKPVLSLSDVLAIQNAVSDVKLEEDVLAYMHDLVLATRREGVFALSVSTRAAIAFERAVRAYALTQGRAFVIPDDVRKLLVPVLSHRVRVRGARHGAPEARESAKAALLELSSTIAAPV